MIKTMEEAFSGLNPKIGNLRIFGYLVYTHVHVEKISNLEPSGKKCIFVGYIET